MVLFTHTPDGKTLCPIRPPADSKPGDLVTFPGFPRDPPVQLNPKKGLWERVQPVGCWLALRTSWRTKMDFVSTRMRPSRLRREKLPQLLKEGVYLEKRLS